MEQEKHTDVFLVSSVRFRHFIQMKVYAHTVPFDS